MKFTDNKISIQIACYRKVNCFLTNIFSVIDEPNSIFNIAFYMLFYIGQYSHNL